MNGTARLKLKLFDDGNKTFKAVYLAYVNHLTSKNENHIILETGSFMNACMERA
jgi:hypothetical protein